MDTRSQLEALIQRNFNCACEPHRAVFRGRGGPKLMLVHSVSCHKPRLLRETVTLFIRPSEVALIKGSRKNPDGCSRARAGLPSDTENRQPSGPLTSTRQMLGILERAE